MAAKTISSQEPAVILRLPAVRRMTGFSTSTIYRLAAEGRFPRQVALGPKSVGWVEREVCDWVDARIAARDAMGQ